MSGLQRPSAWHESASTRRSSLRRSRDRPRSQRRCRGHRRWIGEGGRSPPRPVALDGEAPPGERSVQGGGDDHGATRVDPGASVARGRGHGPIRRIAVCSTMVRHGGRHGASSVGREPAQLVAQPLSSRTRARISPARLGPLPPAFQATGLAGVVLPQAAFAALIAKAAAGSSSAHPRFRGGSAELRRPDEPDGQKCRCDQK